MITRVSLVKLRPGIGPEEARAAWLGPHADVVRACPEVRRYEICFVEGERTGDQWDALAILEFAGREELERWQGDSQVQADLMRTREPFIERVEAFFVERHDVIGGPRPEAP